MDNLFDFPGSLANRSGEYCETLLRGGAGLRVERIVSHGQVTPEGEWYDQEQDEWVAVLEGEASIGYPDGSEIRLRKGDTLLLPKHVRHRVSGTSSPCVWLAVFADSLLPDA